MNDDRWLTRLRALLGSAGFGWEVALDHTQRWWVIIASIWLLGGPIEDLIRLVTAGRIQIDLRPASKAQQEETPEEPDES